MSGKKSNSNHGKSIVDFIHLNPLCSSKEIYEGMGQTIGYATVKRAIRVLLADNMITPHGNGKARRYELSSSFKLLWQVDMAQYFEQEIDDRIIKTQYDHALIDMLQDVSLFTHKEFEYLDLLQQTFQNNIAGLTPIEYEKEFERLAIDLSWKSSQIEGNTYSLLETERLLKEQKTADGKTKDEATMLLNHKAALDFILAQPDYAFPLSVAAIEDIHSLLIKDLNVARNIRIRRVGISGTN